VLPAIPSSFARIPFEILNFSLQRPRPPEQSCSTTFSTQTMIPGRGHGCLFCGGWQLLNSWVADRLQFCFSQTVAHSPLSFRFSSLVFLYPLPTIHYPLSSRDGWPGRKPINDFGCPSSCYSTVYCRSGRLSTYAAVNQKEKPAIGPPVRLPRFS